MEQGQLHPTVEHVRSPLSGALFLARGASGFSIRWMSLLGKGVYVYPPQFPPAGAAVAAGVFHGLGQAPPGDEPAAALALEQVLDRLLTQGLGRALQGDGAGDFHPQGLPHPLGIGLPALAVVLATIAGVEQLVKKGGAQQGRILQQPGGHLDGEPALPADAAAQPPLGPGVHLHLCLLYTSSGGGKRISLTFSDVVV